jgi:hypothetical protein
MPSQAMISSPFQDTTMRNSSELSRAELESIVDQIRDILWRDYDTKEFDPDKEWSSETIEWVSGVLEDAGLKPEDPPARHVDPGSVAADGPTAPRSPGPASDMDQAAMRPALDAFIETIEATGGCVRNEDGLVSPEGDPDWIDLGDAYVRACTAIGRTPRIAGAEDDEEIEEI